jgi:hypothetical protein
VGRPRSPILAYDQDSFTCVTRGATHSLTNAFHSAYTEEVFAVISNDFFAGPKARHVDLAELQADLALVTQ